MIYNSNRSGAAKDKREKPEDIRPKTDVRSGQISDTEQEEEEKKKTSRKGQRIISERGRLKIVYS